MKRVLIGSVAVVVAFVLGFWGSNQLPEDARGFELTRSDGVQINSFEALKGQPYLITFGYTYCPDVCPTTLAYLAGVLQAYQSGEGEAIQSVFVSVDPVRDTPEKLGQYVEYFDSSIWGVTGTEGQLELVKQTYSIFFEKVQGKDPDNYLIDHSAGILVMDSKHRLSGVIREGDSFEQAIATIQNAQ